MSVERLWYEKGLRFECTRCGHCCTGAPGFVWVDSGEISAIAARLDETPERVRALYTQQAARGVTLRERSNGDCIFYVSMHGCTIYDVRPRQCRTWPFWESNVRSEADWERTRQACPGAGHGDLIPADEIARRLREIRL